MPTGQAEAFYKGFLEPLCQAERPELIKDGKFSASLQVHIQNWNLRPLVLLPLIQNTC